MRVTKEYHVGGDLTDGEGLADIVNPATGRSMMHAGSTSIKRISRALTA